MNGVDFIADTNAVIYLFAGKTCMIPLISADKGLQKIHELNLMLIDPSV